MAASGNNLIINYKCNINQKFQHYQSPENKNQNPAIGDIPQQPRIGQPDIPQQPASAFGPDQKHFPRQLQSINDITSDGPKYPEYSIMDARLSSFKHFPSRISQEVKVLAEAGFFYTGKDDCVRCFQCGIGLRNWYDGDDPWVEHARWSEKCKYVIQMKGVLFIMEVQKAVRESESSPQIHDNNNDRDNTDEQNRLLQTPKIRSVMNMGYSFRTVLQALEIFKTTKGCIDYNAEDLMRILLGMEDNNSFTLEQETRTKCVRQEQVLVDSQTSPKQSADVGAGASSKENTELKQQSVCKFCTKVDVALVFFPCGHLGSCLECFSNYSSCKTCACPTQATPSMQMHV